MNVPPPVAVTEFSHPYRPSSCPGIVGSDGTRRGRPTVMGLGFDCFTGSAPAGSVFAEGSMLLHLTRQCRQPNRSAPEI